MKPAADHELACERALKQALADLGLDPTARAKLGLDLARGIDLANAMSDPDPEERRRRLAEAGIEEGGVCSRDPGRPTPTARRLRGLPSSCCRYRRAGNASF